MQNQLILIKFYQNFRAEDYEKDFKMNAYIQDLIFSKSFPWVATHVDNENKRRRVVPRSLAAFEAQRNSGMINVKSVSFGKRIFENSIVPPHSGLNCSEFL